MTETVFGHLEIRVLNLFSASDFEFRICIYFSISLEMTIR